MDLDEAEEQYNMSFRAEVDMMTEMMDIHGARFELGLNRTGHMSFLTGQDRTLKFAGQVLQDRTESGLISLKENKRWED